MITFKRKITVELERRKKNGEVIDNNVPIFLRVTYNANRLNLFTGFRIDRRSWDEETQRVKNFVANNSCHNSDEINVKIANLSSELHSFFMRCQVENRIPETQEVKDVFRILKDRGERHRLKAVKHSSNDNNTHGFFEIFDEFTNTSGSINNWTADTYKKFQALRNHLIKYNPNLRFTELDQTGLTKLIAFFSGVLGLNNVTTKKYIKNIKWFLRFAAKQGYCEEQVFKDFNPKIKTAQKPVIFLSEDEIKKIEMCEIPPNKNYLERVRDVLLFSCFTGLRHSDILKLRKTDVQNGRLHVVTKKTTDSLTIELNNVAADILSKYRHYIDSPLALPVISNQKYNEYLKELAKIAEIDMKISQTYFIGNKRYDEIKPKSELISSHIGRKTFICLCISRGIPVQVIMKWTGHADYQSMRPYIDVIDSTREVEMQKLNFQ